MLRDCYREDIAQPCLPLTICSQCKAAGEWQEVGRQRGVGVGGGGREVTGSPLYMVYLTKGHVSCLCFFAIPGAINVKFYIYLCFISFSFF